MLRFSFIPAVKGGVFKVFCIAFVLFPCHHYQCVPNNISYNSKTYQQKNFERRFVSLIMGLSDCSLCCSENKILQFLQNYDREVMVIS